MTVAEALRDGAERLAEAGIDSPRLEARLLLSHALGWSAEALIRDLTAPVAPNGFDALVARRAAREPLAFILGCREFWSMRFTVAPATLIPRPESETVVEAALACCPDPDSSPRVLDLGTGTGCLLLALLHERPNATGLGVDRSFEAARLARRNALDLALGSRAAFIRGHWADSVGGRFDLVVSNPPYIATQELEGLMPEVAVHEPRLALDGGADGLTAYRAIVADLSRLLTPAGAAVLELGLGQYDAVARIAGVAGFRAEARFDLSGVARAIILRSPP